MVAQIPQGKGQIGGALLRCDLSLNFFDHLSLPCMYTVVTAGSCSSSAGSQSSVALVDVSSSNHGLLSSHVTEASGCGSADWPWLIDVGPGRRLNVTLLDFAPDAVLRHRADQDVATCRVYATVRDGSGAGRSTTVCGGRAPVSHVFLSTSSTVEIRVLQPAGAKVKVNSRSSSDHDDVMPYFLLRYQGLDALFSDEFDRVASSTPCLTNKLSSIQ